MRVDQLHSTYWDSFHSRPLAVGSKKGQQERDAVARGMGTSLTFCEKLKEFYTTTPVVKFVTHTVSFFLPELTHRISYELQEWALIYEASLADGPG